MKTFNHRCIVCGNGYDHCDNCDKMSSFVPWRKVACSVECYQAHLAFLDYRDIHHDAAKFIDTIRFIGISADKLSAPMKVVYSLGEQSSNDKEQVCSASEFEKTDKLVHKAYVKNRKK